MPKAILFNIPASGHVNPTLPVMEIVSQTDLEIVYVNGEDQREKIEATGVGFVPYFGDFEAYHVYVTTPPTGNLPGNAVMLYRICNLLLPFALELIEKEKPDFIIHDSLAPWGKMAARISGLPAISLVTTFILDNSMAIKITPPRTMLMMVPQVLRAYPVYLLERRKMARRYSAQPIDLFDTLMAMGDRNIVFTSADFQPNSARYRDYCDFVGASVGKYTDGDDFPFDQLRDDVPKIYISLGTIARNNDFLRRCFAAFGDMAVQVILSVGKQTDLATLEPFPDNFIVRNFVPQFDLLKQMDVFITHGGANSVREGLLRGVPLIAVPQQPEQAMTAARVTELGAGIGLQLIPPYGDVGVPQLREALEKVLADSSYRETSARLGDGLREAGGAARAAEILCNFV